MNRYWSDVVKSLTPYVPGEQPRGKGIVKLNTNENPYPPSPRVEQAIRAVAADTLRLYPDPDSAELKRAIAQRNALAPGQVFVGNGSDEVIALTFMALLSHNQPICFPDISYSFYPVWSRLFGVEYNTVPVGEDFSIDPQAYPSSNGGIIVPNPNAPTGMAMSLDSIRALLLNSGDSAVVVDEAYIDYGGESAVSLINEFDNLLVIQTLSKSRSLAGLRVGFAMGNAQLIEALERVKNSFNSYPLDSIAQHAALAAIEDEAYFLECCQRVEKSRDRLTLAMTELGFNVLPSRANFIFATHSVHAARELFASLRKRGIIVRYFDQPRIDNYLRISIGSEEAIDALLSALRDIVN